MLAGERARELRELAMARAGSYRRGRAGSTAEVTVTGPDGAGSGGLEDPGALGVGHVPDQSEPDPGPATVEALQDRDQVGQRRVPCEGGAGQDHRHVTAVAFAGDVLDAEHVGRQPDLDEAADPRAVMRRRTAAVLVLTLADGSPMPVGSVVTILGQEKSFPVAQRGEVYVTGLAPENRLRATWKGQSCEFDVEPGPALGSQPRLGPLTCDGVMP